MKKTAIILCVLSLMLVSFTANAENVRGDVDFDGRESIADVTILIDYLLTGDASGISLVNADCDFDGRVTVGDVTCLIDYLLTGSWGDEPVTPDEHEWVDLGLPSGTLWATCNIGASSPEDFGDYFAWGEAAPKEVYAWETYKWCNGSYMAITKYCNDSNYGTVDNKTELEPEDDAAYVYWGPSWRLPSSEQQQELVDNCSWTWTTRNGVNGCLMTGPNGNSIFLPAAGYRWYESLYFVGSYGSGWSRTLGSDIANYAYLLGFGAGGVGWFYYYRAYGFTVRAVRVSQN